MQSNNSSRQRRHYARSIVLRILLAVTLAAFASLIDLEGALAADCRLHLEATVPLGWDAFGRPTVPISIDGSDFDLVVDTGGVVSSISAPIAHKLGLDRTISPFPFLVTFGGGGINEYVIPKQVAFGRLDASSMHLVVEPGWSLHQHEGLFAPEVMRNYEVDFDFANARFNLFNQEHCPGRLAYWTRGPVAEIPFTTDHSGHIQITVQLDGKDVMAGLDTGSADSLIIRETAEQLFGIDPGLLISDPG